METPENTRSFICTENATGDRHNRGGGMSKAMAEMTGRENAMGNDTRALCGALSGTRNRGEPND